MRGESCLGAIPGNDQRRRVAQPNRAQVTQGANSVPFKLIGWPHPAGRLDCFHATSLLLERWMWLWLCCVLFPSLKTGPMQSSGKPHISVESFHFTAALIHYLPYWKTGSSSWASAIFWLVSCLESQKRQLSSWTRSHMNIKSIFFVAYLWNKPYNKQINQEVHPSWVWASNYSDHVTSSCDSTSDHSHSNFQEGHPASQSMKRKWTVSYGCLHLLLWLFGTSKGCFSLPMLHSIETSNPAALSIKCCILAMTKAVIRN